MSFSIPWALFLLPLALVPIWLNRQQGRVYSWIDLAPEDRLSDIASLLLRHLSAAIVACMVIALSMPQGASSSIERTGKGAQISLVIDRSVSMDDPFVGAGVAGKIGETKSAAARRLMTAFVKQRKDDMVGVIAFSNSAMRAIPLTQNREAIYAAIDAASGAGLLQTNIGAGLTNSMTMFEKVPDSGSRVIILLSDGAGRITPKAKQKISDWMRRLHINLYWIVLRQPQGISIFNENYKVDDEGMPPAEIALHQFFQTLKTKYKAYEAENPKALASAIRDINQREKNPIRYSEKVSGRDYSPYFLMMALLMISLLLLIKLLEVQSWRQA